MGNRSDDVGACTLRPGEIGVGMLLFLRDVVVALYDVVLSRRRRRYEHWVEIRAPRSVVWRMLRADDMSFGGFFPIRVVSGPVPGRPDLERLRIQSGNAAFNMIVRIVDQRPGEAILYQVVPDGTDQILMDGIDDYMGFVLSDSEAGTRLYLSREITITSRLGRVTWGDGGWSRQGHFGVTRRCSS